MMNCKTYYITKGDTIIFAPKYKGDINIDIDMISNYSKLIFSDYNLNETLFDSYKNIDSYFFSHTNSLFNNEINNLPSNLTHLVFGYSFDKEVNNLPSNLTHLVFGYSFNQKVDNLPSNLTHLVFGYSFNKEVYNLPNSIEELRFGIEFNQKLDNLPSSIHKINFHQYSKFNLELNCLPIFVEELELGGDFNLELDSFPKSLKYLKLPLKYDKKISQPLNKIMTISCSRKYYVKYKKDLTRYNIKCIKF